MPLTDSQRIAELARWAEPRTASDREWLEDARQLVAEAVARHPAFADLGLLVEPIGSWANGTHLDSTVDIDIRVEFTERTFHGAAAGVSSPGLARQHRAYGGRWTPAEFRSELGAALTAVHDAVDTGRATALRVPGVPGGRPGVRVVPCFGYLHRPVLMGTEQRGTVVFTRDGRHLVNWPRQQLENGRAKDTATGHRYTYAVRALKAVASDPASAGASRALPSYFAQCLIHSVPDETLRAGSLDDAFRGALDFLKYQLGVWSMFAKPDTLLEPNGITRLFGPGRPWTRSDGHALVVAARRHLGYQR
ncbi:hypothetical protein ACFVVU_09425 [Kitasatospora sp. NPDC057965]|uniref:hypothetical protein n=1 Tax=Kitasatospora sp. NPDC057965 TaxID=3346291 RepID=UPI0036DEA1F7